MTFACVIGKFLEYLEFAVYGSSPRRPREQAAAAHEAVERREVTGRAVLVP